MSYVRVYFLNGDIEVFRFSLLKGVAHGNFVIIDSSLNSVCIPWEEIFKVEIYRCEV